MEPLIEKIPEIGASVKTTRNQFISYNIMKPIIKREPEIGASVKTTQNQFLSYNCLTHRGYIYPYTLKIQNGEYFAINIPILIYHKLVKRATVSINSIEDINLLKYIINELYH